MIRNPPDTTLAWLAALIDGEGSVMLILRVPGKRQVERIPALKKPHYRASVCISNTNLKLLREVVKKTGINRIYRHVRPKSKRTAYTWRMVATEIRFWLPKLLPWLVIKKEQSKLLLEALKVAEINTCRAGEKRVSAGYERRHEIHRRIRFLNRKGVNLD